MNLSFVQLINDSICNINRRYRKNDWYESSDYLEKLACWRIFNAVSNSLHYNYVGNLDLGQLEYLPNLTIFMIL